MQYLQKHLPPVQLSSGSYHSKGYRSSESLLRKQKQKLGVHFRSSNIICRMQPEIKWKYQSPCCKFIKSFKMKTARQKRSKCNCTGHRSHETSPGSNPEEGRENSQDDGEGRSQESSFEASLDNHQCTLEPENGIPGGASRKEAACQCRRCKRCKFNPWLGRSFGGRNGNPLQYSCLGNHMEFGGL